MKITRIMLLLAVSAFTLDAFAQNLLDDEDLKIFEETNHCQGCDISEARIYKDHDYGSLLQSYAIRTKFSGSLYKMDFSGSILSYSTIEQSFFSTVYAQLTNFDKANLSYSSLSQVDMSGAKLTDANLSNSDFRYVNFSGADFSNANLQDATFKNSILIGSNINEEQLKQVKSIKCTVLPDGELYDAKDC